MSNGNDFLVFDHVTKRFGALTAVDDVSLSIAKGEFFSLLGPSGCGKTTLLRMLGGFERPDSGRIYLEGKDITDLPPDQRRVHTVFQNYALFPTMTIWDNIAFSLKLAKKTKSEIEEKVDAILEMIQMSEHAWKYPDQLSGGQKQRVAIARALVDRPQVLLLDEPLAALDLKLRQHMLIELDTIHDQVGITFMYVTHDQGEAMSLSDRIAVVNKGRIEQLDVPAKIYEAPARNSGEAQSYFQKAYDVAKQAINNPGPYALQPTFYDVNVATNDRNSEIMLYADHDEDEKYGNGGTGYGWGSGGSPENFAYWMETWNYTEMIAKAASGATINPVQREAVQGLGRPWTRMAPVADAFIEGGVWEDAVKAIDSRYDATFTLSYFTNWDKAGNSEPYVLGANGMQVKPGESYFSWVPVSIVHSRIMQKRRMFL